VDYKTENEIRAMMKRLTFNDVTFGGQGEKFADLLCIKREAFKHEEEVRILFQDLEQKRGLGQLFKYDLDVNNVFEEVVLDPRLTEASSEAVKCSLMSAGCKCPISQSPLYQAPRFVIRME
jgi:hypothetical protein